VVSRYATLQISLERPFKLTAQIVAARRWRAKREFLERAARIARSEFELTNSRMTDLPGLTQDIKDKVRQRCAIAATRIALNWRAESGTGLEAFITYICLLVFLATTMADSLRTDSGPASRIYLYLGVFLVVSVFMALLAVMLARRVNIKMTSLEQSFHLKRSGLLSIVFALALIWTLTDLGESRYSASSHRSVPWLALKESFLTGARTYAVVLGVLFIVFILYRRVYAWFWDLGHKSQRPEPLDHVMVSLLALAQDVNRCRFNRIWNDRRQHEVLLKEFDRIARRAERCAMQRAPRFDFSLRRQARKFGLGLAELIRSQKKVLVQAIGPASYAEVTASLVTILEAWSYRDLARLTSMMPEVTLRELLRPIYRKLWQALALAGLGAVLPLLPVFRHSVTASNIRVYLLIAAVFALVAPGASFSDIADSALGRVIKL
jgi:hypothetical protein